MIIIIPFGIILFWVFPQCQKFYQSFNPMEQHTLKNINSCWYPKILSYLETSGGQNLFLNVAHFLTLVLIRHSPPNTMYWSTLFVPRLLDKCYLADGHFVQAVLNIICLSIKQGTLGKMTALNFVSNVLGPRHVCRNNGCGSNVFRPKVVEPRRTNEHFMEILINSRRPIQSLLLNVVLFRLFSLSLSFSPPQSLLFSLSLSLSVLSLTLSLFLSPSLSVLSLTLSLFLSPSLSVLSLSISLSISLSTRSLSKQR